MGLRFTRAKLSLDCDWKKTWLATLKVEKRSVESAIDSGDEGQQRRRRKQTSGQGSELEYELSEQRQRSVTGSVESYEV